MDIRALIELAVILIIPRGADKVYSENRKAHIHGRAQNF